MYWRRLIASLIKNADAVEMEDHFDDEGATDQRADVQSGDGQQRQARRAQRMPPEDSTVRDALALGHQDEVLLQA